MIEAGFTVVMVLGILYSVIVFSEKKKQSSEQLQDKESAEPKIVYIPVVGTHDEPELKASIAAEGGVKRKPDHAQMASDDYHYDKFKKKVKRY